MDYAFLMLSFFAVNLLNCHHGSQAQILDFNKVQGEAKQEFQMVIAEHLSSIFLHKLTEKQSLMAPVLPTFPPSIPIDHTEINLDDLGLSDIISGHVTLRDGELLGFDTIFDDLEIALTIPARITYDVKAGTLKMFGVYEADAVVKNIYNIPIEGAGNLTATIDNFGLNIVARLLVNLLTNRFTITEVRIDVGFDSIFLYAENLNICAEEVDWDEFNQDAKPNFDQFWAENKVDIEELVKTNVQELIQECRINDLVAGNFSCIGTGISEALSSSSAAPSSNSCLSALNYFVPIMPRLACEPISTVLPSTTTTTTTSRPITTTTTTTTEDYKECSDSKPCPAGTSCEEDHFVGSYCVCTDQIYSFTTYQSVNPCLRIVGASCILSNDNPDYVGCVEHSVCLASNATHGRCECQIGFMGDQRGLCSAGFGQRCGRDLGVGCYEDFSLTCRRGSCACASPDFLFEAGRGCVAPAGEPCNVYNRIEYPHRVKCAAGLQCVQLQVGRHVCQ